MRKQTGRSASRDSCRAHIRTGHAPAHTRKPRWITLGGLRLGSAAARAHLLNNSRAGTLCNQQPRHTLNAHPNANSTKIGFHCRPQATPNPPPPMHPYYHPRPPSRLFWFFLGGVTAAWFIHSRSDRDRAEWRAKCQAWKTRYGLEDSQSQNQSQTYPQGGTQAQDKALEEKYMWWKLRAEREAERMKAQDFQKQMDYAKDTVSLVVLDYDASLITHSRSLMPPRKDWSP